MKKIILFSLAFLIANCSKKQEVKDKLISNTSSGSASFNFDDQELQKNLNQAILNGDTLAYNRSYKKYSINGRDKEFLYYAILMAEKNNYSKAYYDISLILSLPPTDSTKGNYKYKSRFSEYSFSKSYELGDEAAKEIAKYYKRNNEIIPKSSSVYCEK